MKKILALFGAAALVFSLASCGNSANVETESENTGTVLAKIAIPKFIEFEEPTSSRVVMPHTKFVSLKIASAHYLASVRVDSGDIEPGEGVDYCTIAFPGISVGEYAEGEMEVRLLDADGEILTVGTNSAACLITTEHKDKDDPKNPTATFYTFPADFTVIDLTSSRTSFTADPVYHYPAGSQDNPSVSEWGFAAYKVIVNEDTSSSLKVSKGVGGGSFTVAAYQYDTSGVASGFEPVSYSSAGTYDPGFDVYLDDEPTNTYWIVIYMKGNCIAQLTVSE